MFITLPKDPGWKFPKNLWKFRHLDSDLEVFQIDLNFMRISKKASQLNPPEKNTHRLTKPLLAVLMAELGVESRRKSRLPPRMLKLLEVFGTLQRWKNPYTPA